MTAFVVGCGGAAAPAVGRERGACRDDGTCDPGLQCLSKVCVELAGERCEQVGQRAAALLAEAVRHRPLLAAALGAMPARIATLVTEACTEDGWSRAATRCVLDARDHDRLEACLGDLPPGPRAALARREAALSVGDRALDDRPDDPLDLPRSSTQPMPPDPPPPLTGGRLGPQCEGYLALLTRYANCPAMPAAAQQSMRDSVVSVRRSFSQVPADSRHLMEDGCRQASTTMAGALTQLGCP